MVTQIASLAALLSEPPTFPALVLLGSSAEPVPSLVASLR
jgi:hypothetical protein